MSSSDPQPRRRKPGRPRAGSLPDSEPPSPAPSEPAPAPWRLLSLLDVLRFMSGIFLLSLALSYFVTSTPFWGPRPLFTRPAYLLARLRGPLRLTPVELAHYDGRDPRQPLYLGLNGSIYDVSVSPHFYGPGGQYHVFVGRDATRAFVTGCFAEDRTPDLRGAEAAYVHARYDREPDEATANAAADGEGAEARRARRREWKTGRERAWREARAEVEQAVRGWERLFAGRKAGWRARYWWVGTLVGNEAEWEGPVRPLCPAANERRPGMQKEPQETFKPSG